MADLTEEHFAHFYGDDNNHKDFKPNWSEWVAVPWEDHGEYRWCIAPKSFWEANRYIPDWSLGNMVPEGFVETSEHSIRHKWIKGMRLQGDALRGLGFDVQNSALWWCDKFVGVPIEDQPEATLQGLKEPGEGCTAEAEHKAIDILWKLGPWMTAAYEEACPELQEILDEALDFLGGWED